MEKKNWLNLGDNVEIIQVKNEQNSENTLGSRCQPNSEFRLFMQVKQWILNVCIVLPQPEAS